MTWEIDFTHLTASHPSGLKVDIVPDGPKMGLDHWIGHLVSMRP